MKKTSKLIQKVCSFSCTTHGTWQDNALWLAKWDLSSFDNIDAVESAILDIITQTKDMIDIIKKVL